jgi:hypothetical protein
VAKILDKNDIIPDCSILAFLNAIRLADIPSYVDSLITGSLIHFSIHGCSNNYSILGLFS